MSRHDANFFIIDGNAVCQYILFHHQWHHDHSGFSVEPPMQPERGITCISMGTSTHSAGFPWRMTAYLTQGSFYVCAQPMRDDVTFVTLALIGWAHTQNDPCWLVLVTTAMAWNGRHWDRVLPLQWRHISIITLQISSISFVCSTACSRQHQGKHQNSSPSLAFCESLMDSPHKWPVKWCIYDIVVVSLNLLNKQLTCHWFEMPWHSCDVTVMAMDWYRRQDPVLI